MLKPQLRDYIEPCLYSLYTHSFVPYAIDLTSLYTLDVGMTCAEAI